MARKKLSFTTRYVLVFGLLMLFANALLGIVILLQSGSTIRSMVNKNMLDVAETAADLLDGDVLGSLTAEDTDGEVFRKIEDTLLVFQNHEDIRYIYAVKKEGTGRFVFTVDPDPDDPGVFGEEVVVSDALVQAGSGKAAVDDRMLEDRWGNYYSAFCPVFNAAGEVAGIVGIDFDADWYNARIRRHTYSIAALTFLSVLIGGMIVFVITHNVRQRFRKMDAELSGMSDRVDLLIEDAGGVSERKDPAETEPSGDEIERLALKIHSMQKGMAVYERLQKDQYYSDAVTGIPNLNFIRQFAEEKVNMLRAAHAEPAILYFDIRSMVSYNTEYGYTRGDELLKLTAESIREAFPDALAGRGEGDHFIAICGYDGTAEQKILQINEKVKKEAFGHTTGIQCAAVRLEPGQKAMEGIQRARNTLKKIGDNLNVVCRLYSPEDESDYEMTRYIVQHFEGALQDGRIRVFYQPILETAAGRISNLEALARWIDPKKGTISPGSFIPVLSRYHLLHKLDLYMVEQICRESRIREEAGLPAIPVSVNFSAQDFDYINVADALDRRLEQYGISKEHIIVEITEQDLAQATGAFMEQLIRIHESGYRLWIDDFGSGYSSLNVFSRYAIDRIKFDMELVRHLDDNNGANRIIIRTITDMCRQMGIHTLAEGIETEEQYRFLREIGCEMVQGFYFFRPAPAEETLAVLRG